MLKNKFFNFCLIFSSLFISSCASTASITNLTDPNIPRYADTNIVKPAPQANKTIKIVSFNIELCNKLVAAGKLLHNNKDLDNADILCLQEMTPEGAKYLADTLRYNYVYYPSAIHPKNKKYFGQAILSKWPIRSDKKINLPYAQKDKYLKLHRNAVYATVLINDTEILVICAHLGVIISPLRRKNQLETIIKHIPNSANNVIICGDFNTYCQIHIKAINEILDEYGFKNATIKLGATYTRWYLLNQGFTMDHIFFKGMKLIKAGKIKSKGSSDHMPIWAEFTNFNSSKQLK